MDIVKRYLWFLGPVFRCTTYVYNVVSKAFNPSLNWVAFKFTMCTAKWHFWDWILLHNVHMLKPIQTQNSTNNDSALSVELLTGSSVPSLCGVQGCFTPWAFADREDNSPRWSWPSLCQPVRLVQLGIAKIAL